MLDANTLPNDVASLKRLVIERDREVEHLKLQLAKLRRWKNGQSSEALEASGQLTLTLQELKAAVSQAVLENAADSAASATGALAGRHPGEEAPHTSQASARSTSNASPT